MVIFKDFCNVEKTNKNEHNVEVIFANVPKENGNKLYVFSGLGADERVFTHIDFGAYKPVFIRWITPLHQEKIEDYATRISTQITTVRPILIGLSFGGIIAIEIAKQIPVAQIILIASVKTKTELPPYFMAGKGFMLHKFIPASILKQANFITYWFFGIKTAADKKLLKNILYDTDPGFLKWGIDKIAHWKNSAIPANIIHIHGTNDKIFPLKYINYDYKVIDGGHFMAINKAERISELIKIILLLPTPNIDNITLL